MAGEPVWVDDVLSFWFGELSREQHFKRDETVDQRIRHRFSGLYEKVLAGREPIDETSPRAVLAAAIVLDQFPRNMFRGSPRAFEADPLARRMAATAVDRGLDERLGKDERLFLYLPFEHSENAADQVRSVALIGALGDDELTRYAVAHKVIIDRFGRYPHRNAVLGRTSTPEELAFLKEPMSSF